MGGESLAEFCLDCLNEQMGTHFTDKDVLLEDDLCEGCGEVKPCVIVIRSWRRKARLERIWRIVLPLIVLLSVLSGMILYITSAIILIHRWFV